ncbi:hypothetical protein B0H34DRAFT_843808 [Crassisporium funariophilum]|nr:hypothetical protein B0H34DRAFT_843808 [Crassisporium funariophilum]
MNKRRPSSPLPLEMKIQKQRVSALTFVGPCGHDHKSVDQSIISAYQDIIDTTTGKTLMVMPRIPCGPTHRLGDASCLTTAALWKAIARGTAWQCCDGMPGIDQLIPFVRGRHAKLGRGTVSAIAIQNKDRKTALKVKLGDKFPARLFADAPGGTRQSFIFLTMQLGVQLSAAAAAKATKAATPITPSKTSVGVPPRIRTTRSVEVDNRPGRYDITINGCSPTVYQVIREEDRSHWAQLSAARSLKSELPRQTPPHMELLVRSKPLFWSGAPSFDWAEDADGKVHVNEEQEEKIEFGKGEEEEDDI